jgi:anthranilate phosphoribosyltransferase
VRSIFNLLGPLANPARAPRQLLGVYASALVPVVAETLARLGRSGALVVHGLEGLDEISPSGPTRAPGSRPARSARSSSSRRTEA